MVRFRAAVMTFGVAALLVFFAFEVGHGDSSTAGHDCGSLLSPVRQSVPVFAKACDSDHTGATVWFVILLLAALALVIVGARWQASLGRQRQPDHAPGTDARTDPV